MEESGSSDFSETSDSGSNSDSDLDSLEDKSSDDDDDEEEEKRNRVKRRRRRQNTRECVKRMKTEDMVLQLHHDLAERHYRLVQSMALIERDSWSEGERIVFHSLQNMKLGCLQVRQLRKTIESREVKTITNPRFIVAIIRLIFGIENIIECLSILGAAQHVCRLGLREIGDIMDFTPEVSPKIDSQFDTALAGLLPKEEEINMMQACDFLSARKLQSTKLRGLILLCTRIEQPLEFDFPDIKRFTCLFDPLRRLQAFQVILSYTRPPTQDALTQRDVRNWLDSFDSSASSRSGASHLIARWIDEHSFPIEPQVVYLLLNHDQNMESHVRERIARYTVQHMEAFSEEAIQSILDLFRGMAWCRVMDELKTRFPLRKYKALNSILKRHLNLEYKKFAGPGSSVEVNGHVIDSALPYGSEDLKSDLAFDKVLGDSCVATPGRDPLQVVLQGDVQTIRAVPGSQLREITTVDVRWNPAMEQKSCSICEDDRETLGTILPCRHSRMCRACVKRVERCPMCRGRILFVPNELQHAIPETVFNSS